MKEDIDTIFSYLSWDNCDKTQLYGIEIGRNIKHLSVFIMPVEDMSIWENCSRIIIEKTDEELDRYIYDLFQWLKDMNWPGAYNIYERLIQFADDIFLPAYQYSLNVARKLEDHTWEKVLSDLYTEYIYYRLDRNRPLDVQSKGLYLAETLVSIKPFIQPTQYNNCNDIWENCAVIVAKQSDDILSPYLEELLSWLKNMNTPGALHIFNRLNSYSDQYCLCKSIDSCLKKARDCKDDEWINNLIALKRSQR